MLELRGMKHLAYLQLGQHRGNCRLWLSSKRLGDAGWSPGDKFSLSFDDQSRVLTIQPDADGDRKVSRKRRIGSKGDVTLPVIDINNEALSQMFGAVANRVRVIITDRSIIVTLHPEDEAAVERHDRLMNSILKHKPLGIGSLSHGGGIMDDALHRGLESQGVAARLAFAIEIEHRYLESSLSNNPAWDEDSISIHAPMQEVEPHLLPKVDIYVGGIPCTGVSKAGKAKNKNQHAEDHVSAGALVLPYLTMLKATNPSVVVLENVPDYQNTASMSMIRAVLTGLGYDVHEAILDGMGQTLEERRRLFMVAVTRGLKFSFDNLVPVRTCEATLGQVMDDVPPESQRWGDMQYLKEKEVSDAAKGNNFKRQEVGPESTMVGTIGREYWKRRSTEPMIAGEGGRLRLLTELEHARVKGGDPVLTADCNLTTAHEIWGQSVLPPTVQAIGELIGRTLVQAACRDMIDGEVLDDEQPEDFGMSME